MTEEQFGYEEIVNKPINSEGLKELFTVQRPMIGELEQKAIERADKWIKESIETKSLTYWLSYKLGYIDGAIENSIQWHDLRKDPNDLPKNEGSYLVCIEFNYRHTYILNYGQDEYDDEEKLDWYDDESTHYSKEVIAWCEIPLFKE